MKHISETLDALVRQYIKDEKAMFLRSWGKSIPITVKQLHEAQAVFRAISQNECRLRVESKDLSLYSENRAWLLELSKHINATEWWEPNHTLEPETIIMGPSMEGWEYRVTLGSRISDDFSAWALNNLDKIRLGPTFKNALLKNRSAYLYGLYFYVKNEKMLNLVTLVLGSSIARIDKIIIEDKKA